MSNSFSQVFGGTTIYPSDVSYLPLALTSNISLEWPLEAVAGGSVVARIIDVTPTGAYTITMPDATAVSVGQTVLFNNLGPNTITVNKADGNAILSINAGEQWQAYLINNSTIGGQWRTLRYGAAVAQAQAAALAGPGLTASGSILAQNYDVVDFSATPYTLTGPDRARVFVWKGGLGTLNLPTAAAAGDGWFVQVRNGGQGDLTIDPSGSELINAAATLRLQPGDSAVVVSDGVQWYTIGLGQQAVFAFDYTSLAVTGGTYTLSGSELNRIAYKFTGTLTSNAVIVVPATVQQYWVNNATSGPFTLGLRAAGSATVTTVGQNATAILYCDGTDVVPATTSVPFAGVLPVSQGGTGGTTAASARANLGATGIGSDVFTAATTAAARTAIAAAASGANSDITSLTGLTSPLSVSQGGTGANAAAGARANLSAAASGANSDITSLNPASGLVVGAPTGGARGVGTINATGLFINGVGVGTGSGSVTSVAFSGGTTGLTVTGSPITTSGTITLGGTLAAANGGTGQSSYTDGQLLIGNTSTGGLAKATLTAGTGILITNGGGSITVAATNSGTVTSVGMSGGTTGLTFSGSPITTSGTITVGGTLAIANGGTNASSASGARLNLGAAASGVNSDITSLTGLTTAITVAQGGTGATSLTANFLPKGNGTSAYTASQIFDNGTQVGIGTSTPAAKLEVARTDAAAGIRVTVGQGAYSGQVALFGVTGQSNGYYITKDSANNIEHIWDGTGGAERMRITSAGNVGVATSAPWERLSLPFNNGIALGDATYSFKIQRSGAGDLVTTFSDTYNAASARVDFTMRAGAVTPLSLLGSGNVAVGGTIDYPVASDRTLSVSGSAFASLNLVCGGAFSGAGLTVDSAGTLQIRNSGVERARINASGNVGIGTTSPGALLDVNGTLRANSLTLTTALPIAQGGTGATTAGAALTALGAYAASNPAGYTSNTGTVTSVSGTGSANGLSLSGTVTTSGNITLSGSVTSVATTATIDGVTIGFRSIPRSTTSGTAAVSDVGKCIAVTAGITIPNATFAAGDAVSIYNDSASAVTITQGASLTLRQAGTTNTGNRTLAARGMATIWFNSASEAIISGAGVS